jgi:hypothetical protein
MFTVEINVNGNMISHISGVNKGYINKGECKYSYYYRRVGEETLSGEVTHKREEGMEKLITIILEKIYRQIT